MQRKVLYALFLVLVTTVQFPAWASSDQENAVLFVEQKGADLVSLMSTPPGEARTTLFSAWLNDVFDLEVIGDRSLGVYRKALTEDELARFRTVFKNYVIASYENLLSSFADYTITVYRTRLLGESDIVVRTQVSGGKVDPFNVDFRLRRELDGSLRANDIAIEGVSMVTAQRDEFSAVIRRDTIAGLIELLEANTSHADGN